MRKEQIVAPLAQLSLFYSYAHEDEVLRDQLEKHLRQLQRQGLISAWHDREILPGGLWAHEIDTHLETASLILLLVSPDFLASDYCYENEMQRALARHERGTARVVPIILRSCDWQHSPLKDLQCLPRDGRPVTQWQDQDEIFNTITQGLRRIIEQQQALAHPPIPLSPLNRQNRMRLLKQVRVIWIDGLLTQSLHQAARIELHLQDRPDVLANPWQLQVQELHQVPQVLPNGTTIVQVYDRADSELLILGEPGAGKTTLLLELTRTLLERAEQDEQLRMPIVFNLSSWAEKRLSLSAWLVEELWTKYRVPRKIGQSWVDADQILPLLDGLDEVAKDARRACINQINNYYQSRLEQGGSPIVVCCRSEEYAALSTYILLQHAVSILPLTDEQINAYLEQAGEQVQGLRQALNEDTELHDLARQPLMLTIFTFAYRGASVEEIPTGETGKEMQHAIFARYVEHMLKRRGQSKRWQPEQVMSWLTFLAKQMQQHDQTVFFVESLQPDWLSRRWKILYQWCVGLFFGLAVGPIFGLVIGSFIGLSVNSNFGLLAGLIFGLLSVPLFGLLAVQFSGINLAGSLTWSWKNIRFALPLSLFAGLILGLFGKLLVYLALGLIFGLIFGVSEEQLPEHYSLSPNEVIRRSGRNGLLVGLVWGLLAGSIFALLVNLIFGLLVGLSFMLFGLSVLLTNLVKHFSLRFFLFQRGIVCCRIILQN
jgi:GTPase SAR1 family protein